MAGVRAIGRFVQLALLATLLAACSVAPRQEYSARENASAHLPGIPEARYWADSPDVANEAAYYSRMIHGRFSYLALSGGGGDGAFGAGLLKGWTETGKRPQFTIVSGVSTGALIAPFAFLGSAYDDVLREMYTGGYGITLVDSPDLAGALFGPGVFDSRRLLALSRKFVTSDVIAAVAREHRKGRRLLVLTTNLDAQRPVIWNMGAIAASGIPGSDDLFREILTASASIPGIFTPTMISAMSGSRAFQEMHVDGGVISNVFILPDELLMKSLRFPAKNKGDIYVIMNGKLEPAFELIPNKTVEIVGRSLSTMISVKSRTTLKSTYDFTRRNGMGFHLSYIPREIDNAETMMFDTDEMRKLYSYGLEYGRSGKAWSSTPLAFRAR